VAKPAQASPGPEPRRWLVQFKRQATDRGTDDESTRSQLKFEYFPDGMVNLLRLELPFPDEKTDLPATPSILAPVTSRSAWA